MWECDQSPSCWGVWGRGPFEAYGAGIGVVINDFVIWEGVVDVFGILFLVGL